MTYELPVYLPNSFELLESMGFEFHLDWDDELEITYDESMTMERIANWLRENYTRALQTDVKFRSERDRCVFVEGPFNGEKHHEKFRYSIQFGQIICKKVRRAHWAVYKIGDDNCRAFFEGYASSEAKAKQGKLKPVAAKETR